MKREDGSAIGALPDCRGRRFAIVSAEFYADLGAQLLDGARRGLRDCGVADDAIGVFGVPGCFELPLACKRVAARGYDGIVALGVVVRGDTPHFDYVAGECARGIMDVQLRDDVPIGFGVLTTENLAQAQERADPARGDKGYEAAVAAARVVALQAKERADSRA